MQLVNIRLYGVMQGPIYWPVGEICDVQFCKDFNPPHAPTLSNDWPGFDEAMQEALECGDFQVGMGDLLGGWLEFHLVDQRGTSAHRQTTICKALEDMVAARPYLAS